MGVLVTPTTLDVKAPSVPLSKPSLTGICVQAGVRVGEAVLVDVLVEVVVLVGAKLGPS